MPNRKDSDKTGSPEAERRKKKRRLGTERRDQARWNAKNPIRRKSPGRRALDRLLHALNFIKK